jgi:hypothetical protein
MRDYIRTRDDRTKFKFSNIILGGLVDFLCVIDVGKISCTRVQVVDLTVKNLSK